MSLHSVGAGGSKLGYFHGDTLAREMVCVLMQHLERTVGHPASSTTTEASAIVNGPATSGYTLIASLLTYK